MFPRLRMTVAIDTIWEVDTPEHVAFRTRVAGPGRRMFAWLIDFCVRALIFMVLSLVFGLVSGAFNLPGLGTGLLLLLMFLLDWAYFVACELWTGGRSPGKIALKLRVVRNNGLPLGWRETILRNLLRAADMAIFPPFFLFLGPAVMAVDPRFRRLGDLVAGTLVVVEESSKVKEEPEIKADDQILAELPAVLPLDREDLEAIELFVNREGVSEDRRRELAEIVSYEYAVRLNLPRPRDPSRFLASLWARSQDSSRRSGR